MNTPNSNKSPALAKSYKRTGKMQEKKIFAGAKPICMVAHERSECHEKETMLSGKFRKNSRDFKTKNW